MTAHDRISVLTIIGTRPEAIKMAPVVRELESRPEIESILCTTGQHRELLDQMLQVFSLTPAMDLNLMRPNQEPVLLLSGAIAGITDAIRAYRPDWILVQGDTTTALAGALAGFYNRVKVGHVEAGLRTGKLDAPFPEEANRHLISVVTTLNFAPTEHAQSVLLTENIPADRILLTGNPIVDAVLHVSGVLPKRITPAGRRRILVTVHRRESFGTPIESIFNALKILIERFEDIEIFYPVHPNPNVQEPAKRILGAVDRVHLLPPLDYLAFLMELRDACLVLSDSGGVSEEGPSLKVPVLVLRDETDRPEALQAGCAKLAGRETNRIVEMASELLSNPASYAAMVNVKNPFGDGTASKKIAAGLLAGPRGS